RSAVPRATSPSPSRCRGPLPSGARRGCCSPRARPAAARSVPTSGSARTCSPSWRARSCCTWPRADPGRAEAERVPRSAATGAAPRLGLLDGDPGPLGRVRRQMLAHLGLDLLRDPILDAAADLVGEFRGVALDELALAQTQLELLDDLDLVAQ